MRIDTGSSQRKELRGYGLKESGVERRWV